MCFFFLVFFLKDNVLYSGAVQSDLSCSVFLAEEVCVNPMLSYNDSCNCSDSSDIELSDEWAGKKSPKLSRGNRSPEL